MKASRQCPKCTSKRIGFLEMQADQTKGSPTGRALGFTGAYDGYIGQSKRDPIGLLEAYVCMDCGYHESYVTAPDRLQWQQLAGFHYVNQN